MSVDALRSRILDAAEACLLEAGTSGRIHGLIADRAGVSRPTVYKYVGDQGAIIEALLRREVDRYLDEVRSVLSRGDSQRKQFLDIVVFSVLYLRSHALFQTLLRDRPDAILPWLTTRGGPGLRLALNSLADRITTQGHIPPPVVVEWAIRIAVSIATTPSVTTALDTPTDIERYVVSLFNIGSALAASRD